MKGPLKKSIFDFVESLEMVNNNMDDMENAIMFAKADSLKAIALRVEIAKSHTQTCRITHELTALLLEV